MKNLFMDENKPIKFVSYLFSFGIILLWFLMIKTRNISLSSLVLSSVLFLLPYVIALFILKYFNRVYFYNVESYKVKTSLQVLDFSLCSIGLILLQGIIIPIGLLTSDLQSFATEYSTFDIIKITKSNVFCFIGLYFIWGSISIGLIKKEL